MKLRRSKSLSVFAALFLLMATLFTPSAIAAVCGVDCSQAQPARVLVCSAGAEATCCSSDANRQPNTPEPVDPTHCGCCHEVPAVDARAVLIPREKETEQSLTPPSETETTLVVWSPSEANPHRAVPPSSSPPPGYSADRLHLRLCVLIC